MSGPYCATDGKVVYVAGPFTQGGEGRNTRRAIDVAEGLKRAGHFPIVPHLNAAWDMVHPDTWEGWLRWCLPVLEKCDAVVRVPGDSPGADVEVDHARASGIPVHFLPDVFTGASSFRAVEDRVETWSRRCL